MKIKHYFKDGTKRTSVDGVKVPKTSETAQAYAAIAKKGAAKK